MRVKDIMTKDVICLEPKNTFSDAVSLFSEKKISGAPVTKRKKLVGMVSESDVARFVANNDLVEIIEKRKDEFKKVALTEVRKMMTKNLITVRPEEEVEKAVKLINTKDINRLPVVDKHNKVVGIMTRADVVSIVSEHVAENPVVKPKQWEADKPTLETDIDKLLDMVKEKKRVKFSEAAKAFKVSEGKIEGWGEILEDYNYVKVHFPPVGAPVITLAGDEHDKKKRKR